MTTQEIAEAKCRNNGLEAERMERAAIECNRRLDEMRARTKLEAVAGSSMNKPLEDCSIMELAARIIVLAEGAKP